MFKSIKKICPMCKKEFYCRPSQIYCSKKCFGKSCSKSVTNICKICGNQILVPLGRIKIGRGKYCSKKCHNISKIGKIAWNKGLKGFGSKFGFQKNHTFCKGGEKGWFKKGDHVGENHPNWKGGKYKTKTGYIFILCHSHPFCNKQGYVLEHRLVMERYLGRYLKPEERVHHINGIKDDNRIENLMLFANEREHQKFHYAHKALLKAS